MRIGILTFHTAHNYGAVLQCYALQEFLIQEKHDVEVIDYQLPCIVNGYKWFDISRILCKHPYYLFIRLIREFRHIIKRKKRYDQFTKFINNKIHLGAIENIQKKTYDYIIIGSDQVWNYSLTNGMDNYYWGDFSCPNQTRIISYAASMHDKWPKSLDNDIINKLNKFDSISVRETELARKLSNLLPHKNIIPVLDPTLILSSNFWDKMAQKPNIKYPYLFLYQVEPNDKTEQIARQIAEDLNLKIVYLSATVKDINTAQVVAASPKEFVGLFKYADFVVCSSFHGTIFSLQFCKKFYSIKMGLGKDNRVGNLLNNLNLEYLFIDKYTTNMVRDCNFNYDHQLLAKLRLHSIEYIRKALSREN